MPDIFDFFKENEEKLHERPSEQVWQKLEQKLERNRRPIRRRGIRFLQTWLVALVLLLLIVAAALVWLYAGKM